MGFFDFFKNMFKKQTCAFCGGECGVMSRTKIKGDEYICSKCDDACSLYIRKDRFTKDELKGHMEYMKRCDRIFKEVIGGYDAKSDLYPLPVKKQGLQFFDDFGMFIIRERSKEKNETFLQEVFRYDQVASYDGYIDEKESSEAGKPKEFVEAGIKLKLIGGLDVPDDIRKGAMAHPYITNEIKIVIASGESNKNDAIYIKNIIAHFDHIFGVHDSEKGLFQVGMSKEEKRNLMGGVAMVNTFVDAVKIASSGQNELTEEQKAEFEKNKAMMDDAQTGGLAVYTRRADDAWNKIN